MIIIRQIGTFEELERICPKISGLFQSISYQKVFVNHFVSKDDLYILGIFDDSNCIGYGFFERQGETILFSGMKKVLGNQEVSDYGDIMIDSKFIGNIQEIWNKLMLWFKNINIYNFQLDYIREDSPTYGLFRDNATELELAPYINLPQTWDLFLETLERKDRKELKRKIKRLDTVKHEYFISDMNNKNLFEEFIKLHRLSNVNKEQFMTDEMKQFFLDLSMLKDNYWKPIINFLSIEGINVASALTFENENVVFAYNSGHDPSCNFYSAGLLLHAFIIKRSIDEKKEKYDFLRGKERYKFDLGGKPMKLFRINIRL